MVFIESTKGAAREGRSLFPFFPFFPSPCGGRFFPSPFPCLPESVPIRIAFLPCLAEVSPSLSASPSGDEESLKASLAPLLGIDASDGAAAFVLAVENLSAAKESLRAEKMSLEAEKEALVAARAELETAKATLETELTTLKRRELGALVDGAVKDGRLDAGRRDHFLSLGERLGSAFLAETLGALRPAVKLSAVVRKDSGWCAYEKLSEVPEDERLRLRRDEPEEYARLYRAEYGREADLRS